MTDPAFYVRAGQTGANLRGTAANVLTFIANQRMQGQPAAGGGLVSSVFGRAGAVVAALNDYAASLISNDSSVAGATVRAALNTLLAALVASGIANDSSVAGATVKDALNTLLSAGGAVSSVFTRTGAVVAAAGDYTAAQVNNNSVVPGTHVDNALTNLQRYMATAGAALATGNQTIPTVQRDVLLAGTLAAASTFTFTPASVTAYGGPVTGSIEVGIQGFDLILSNGGPVAQTFTIPAGQRLGVSLVHDGGNVSFAGYFLGNNPTL